MNCQVGQWVPLWELEFHLWDQASGRHVVLGKEFEGLTPAQQDKALHVNAEIMLSVAGDLGFSMITVPGTYWEVAPGDPAYLWLPAPMNIRQIEILRKMADKDFLLCASSGGVMAMPGASNYLEFSYKLFDAPEEIDRLAEQELADGIENAKRFRDAGVDAVFTASDIAMNTGPFYKPDQMERWILPSLRAWSQAVKAMGLFAIIHTDGNVMPCLEGIATSGVQAFQAIDPIAGMDIAAVKQQVQGRLCLCGNVDCGLLQFGPAQKVYDHTANLLRTCKAGGGLVLGASNAVFREAPIEHYRAMIHAWRDFKTLV